MDKLETFHPSGAIFDMDGLMLDSEGPAIPLWAVAAKPFGYDVSAETVIRTLGINEEGTREIMLNEHGPDFPYGKIREELSRLTREKFAAGIDCKPGLIRLLDHLAALGVPLAVATSTRRESAFWKLRQAGIFDRFAFYVCGDEVSRGKPAPDIFLRAAEKLGLPPAACLGFEDSTAGLQGLRAAGIRSVFVKDILEPPPEVLAGVWKRFANLAEAVPYIV